MQRLSELVASGNIREMLRKVRELAKANKWHELSTEIALPLGKNATLFKRFSILAPQLQERILASPFLQEYAQQASENGEKDGITYLLACSIALGFRDIALDIAENLTKSEDWKPLSHGIAYAFGRNSELHRQLQMLSEPEYLWKAMLPYALMSAHDYGEHTGLKYLLKYHNPAKVPMKRWLQVFSEVADVSTRADFLIATVNPRVEHIREDWSYFTPDEYAVLVAMYARNRGFTIRLRTSVVSAVESEPAILASLVKFAQRYPRELVPVIRLWLPEELGPELTTQFVNAVVNPLLNHIRHPEQFTPEEWAWLVVRYFLKRRKVTKHLIWTLDSVVQKDRNRFLTLIKFATKYLKDPTPLLENWLSPVPADFWDNLRSEFMEALLAPKLSHLQSPEQFTPEEYAWLVVKYIQTKGGITPPLLQAVRQAVSERPEILEGIKAVANNHPGELLPLFNELLAPYAGGYL